MKLKCNVCEHEIEVSGMKEGRRLTCPNCFAQLAVNIINGKKVLRCAICRKGEIECSADCEIRFSKREKRGFFDVNLD